MGSNGKLTFTLVSNPSSKTNVGNFSWNVTGGDFDGVHIDTIPKTSADLTPSGKAHTVFTIESADIKDSTVISIDGVKVTLAIGSRSSVSDGKVTLSASDAKDLNRALTLIGQALQGKVTDHGLTISVNNNSNGANGVGISVSREDSAVTASSSKAITTLEAAAYILQSGGDYKISYTCFRDLYNAGHFREDILPLMSAVFYEPNEKTLRGRYERNRKLLERYPFIFRLDFPAFEDLPIQFFPYDEHNGYVPFYHDTMLFGDFVNVKHPVVSRNFFKDLDKPILATDVFSQYELEYLNDNVRKSEHIGRENHVYPHYTSWETFCAWLQVLNLRPLLKEQKLVFLIGDEVEQYPIDFKERFNIDYSQFPVKPLGLREINRIIWHTQLSTHNGGDFFNEIFDAHPNLLPLTSIMLDSMEKNVSEWRKALNQTKSSKEAK